MTKQANALGYIHRNIVAPIVRVFDDNQRAEALKEPLTWFKTGILVCALNIVLILLMTPSPYMQPTIVVETIKLPGIENELPVKTVSSTGPQNMYLALAGYVFCGFMLYYLKENVDKMSAVPTTIMFRRLDEPRIEGLTRKTALSMKIPTPKVVVIDQLQDPLVQSYIPSTNRASIVICQDGLEVLNEEEIEAVFAHEMYHIKSDAPGFVYQRIFEGEKMFATFPFFLFFLLAIIEGPTLLLLFPLTVLDVYFPIAFELFWFTLALQFFGMIMALLYALQSIEILNFLFFRDIFQYSADSFAALGTEKTLALSTALIKIDFLKAGSRVDTENAIATVKKHYTIESLSKLGVELRPSLFGAPQLGTRIRVLMLVHALLYGEIAFKFKKTFKVEKARSEGFHIYTNPFEKRVKTLENQELAALTRHLSTAKQGVNLKKLQQIYGDSAQNLLALFLFWLTNGYIELVGISPINQQM